MTAAMALLLAACSPVARRPEAATMPWWEAPEAATVDVADTSDAARADDEAGPVLLARGSGDSLVVVMPDSGVAVMQRPAPAARPTSGDEAAAVDSAAGAGASDTIAASAPQVIAARRQARAARQHADRERVLEVNEYALWCVEQGLWKEARIHLEQALERDSLAASLHNNLAIVYEREGRGREARRHYAMAAELNPDRELYQANLRRLRKALEHRPPVADSLADSAVLLPPARGEYRPDEAGGTSRTEGDSQL